MFFVWISVFNLFAVSVFWSFMADLYSQPSRASACSGSSPRAASAGALLGPGAHGRRSPCRSGPVNLLIVAALLLELAVLCARRLELPRRRASGERTDRGDSAATRRPRLGGGWLAGIAMVLRSPYLAGIALWVALLSIAGTFLYFQQANIVAAASDDPAVRTRIFATHRSRGRHADDRRAVLRDRHG